MPSKLNSKQQKCKEVTRNWLELPSDLMMNILQRISVVDILHNAQKVCTAWHEICKEPALWRIIYMDIYFPSRYELIKHREMYKHAVDRSQGQLLDLTIIGFCDKDLLQYVVERSSQLRRLEIVQYTNDFNEIWSEAFKKLPLLEELSLLNTRNCEEIIEAATRYCPLLKTLKVSKSVGFWNGTADDSIALAIGKNLPELTHLELIGNSMTNTGLQAILDGCCLLESLDLRRCFGVDIKGDLGKRCSQQIKYLKFPNDFLSWYYYLPLLKL